MPQTYGLNLKIQKKASFFLTLFLFGRFLQSRHDDDPDIGHDVVVDDLQGVDATAAQCGSCYGCGP